MRNKWKCIPLFLLHDWLPLEYVFTYNISYRSSRSQMFFKIAVLNNFANPQENICVGVLIEKRLQHRDFPVNIATFLRTAFFIEPLWWLLLFFDVVRNRLVFSRFFYIRGNLGNVKEKPTRKTCFSHEMKRLALRIYLAKFY